MGTLYVRSSSSRPRGRVAVKYTVAGLLVLGTVLLAVRLYNADFFGGGGTDQTETLAENVAQAEPTETYAAPPSTASYDGIIETLVGSDESEPENPEEAELDETNDGLEVSEGVESETEAAADRVQPAVSPEPATQAPQRTTRSSRHAVRQVSTNTPRREPARETRPTSAPVTTPAPQPVRDPEPQAQPVATPIQDEIGLNVEAPEPVVTEPEIVVPPRHATPTQPEPAPEPETVPEPAPQPTQPERTEDTVSSSIAEMIQNSQRSETSSAEAEVSNRDREPQLNGQVSETMTSLQAELARHAGQSEN